MQVTINLCRICTQRYSTYCTSGWQVLKVESFLFFQPYLRSEIRRQWSSQSYANAQKTAMERKSQHMACIFFFNTWVLMFNLSNKQCQIVTMALLLHPCYCIPRVEVWTHLTTKVILYFITFEVRYAKKPLWLQLTTQQTYVIRQRRDTELSSVLQLNKPRTVNPLKGLL